jgi:hypothetical protein
MSAEVKQAVRAATGLAFPADFAAVLGDRAVLAVNRVNDSEPSFAVRTHPRDVTAATRLAQTLAGHLSDSSAHLAVQSTGGDVVVASSEAYAKQVAVGVTVHSQGGDPVLDIRFVG